jgi:hypothetical protein
VQCYGGGGGQAGSERKFKLIKKQRVSMAQPAVCKICHFTLQYAHVNIKDDDMRNKKKKTKHMAMKFSQGCLVL